jgi:vanillate O-demethylase monooxygenase subunit
VTGPVGRPEDTTFHAGDWTILSRWWFPIAVAEDVVGVVAARLLDTDLVVFRGGDGAITVAIDRCPHRGMALSRGWMESGRLICPYHGLHFDGAGACTAIPSDPNAAIPEALRLTVLPSVERFGLVWTSLAGDTPDLPRFEAWDDEGFQSIVCPTLDIAASAGRQVEGFLDVAHFAWVHTTTFGDGADPVVTPISVERTEAGLKAVYASAVSNYGPGSRHLAPADFEWRRTFEVFPPFAARLIVDYPEGKQLWILNIASPVSARATRLFCSIARNFDLETSVDDVRAFNLRVFNEDRALVEHQRPLDLPLDSEGETHIAADRTSVAYRRVLKRMGLDLRARR